MKNKIIALGCALAAISVILGAFGAHSLKAKLSESGLDVFKTAVQYQMYHAIAILFVAQWMNELDGRRAKLIVQLFTVGIILFSGSLYIFTMEEVLNTQRTTLVGIATPLGGVCFISAWVLACVSMLKINSRF